MEFFTTYKNQSPVNGILNFANFCRKAKKENLKQIILNILYKVGNFSSSIENINQNQELHKNYLENNCAVPTLLYMIFYGDLEKYEIELPKETILLLFFMKDNLYEPENWNKIYHSLLIHQRLSSEIRKVMIYISFSVIILFILFLLRIMLIKKTSFLQNTLLFSPNIMIILFAIFSLKNIKAKFQSSITLSYFILALFNPSGNAEAWQNNHYFTKIPQYHHLLFLKKNGCNDREILSFLSLGGLEDSLISFKDLNNIMENEVNNQLRIYSEKINNYLSFFSQLFLVGIIGTALFITLDSSREIKKRHGIYKKILFLKKSSN